MRRALLAWLCLPIMILVGVATIYSRNHADHLAVASMRQERDTDEQEGEEATEAEGMARERYLKRLDSKGMIPLNALLLAKKQADRMPIMRWPGVQRSGRVPQDAGITGWEWLGPGNIGGRIRSIVFTNPTTLFIGAVSGGIWKSTNLGASWTPVNDFMASLEVSCMTVDPTNPNILYAGTGEGFSNSAHEHSHYIPGAGIFKSTDGGTTWNLLPNPRGWQFVFRLAHHPTQTGTLLAATDNGLYQSTDGGVTWPTQIFPGTWLDVKYDRANASRILAANSGQVQLWREEKATWEPETTWDGTIAHINGKMPNNGLRSEVAFGAGGVMWVSMNGSNNGQLWKSTDDGAHWAPTSAVGYLANSVQNQGEYANVVWGSPDDPNLVVVGGLDLWKSVDGGQTFYQLSDWHQYHPPTNISAHADQHVIVSPPDYGPNNRRVYFGNDGGIQMAQNILTTSDHSGWTNLAHGLGITQFYGGAVHPSGEHIIGGAQDNDTLRYRAVDNSTEAWYQFETGDGGFCAYNPQNIYHCYKEWTKLRIRKSTDGGDTYFSSTDNLFDTASGNALFIAPFVMAPDNAAILVAGGQSIWRTTIAADSWNSIRDPIPGGALCSAIDIASDNNTNTWIGYTDGTISRTDNNDVTQWKDVNNKSDLIHPHPPPRWVTDIAINPFDSRQVFVTVGGYQNDTVWFTEDNGVSWKLRHGTGTNTLPNIQINTIKFHPSIPGWVYVGTDLGVFASEDKGLTWSRTPRFPGLSEGPANVEVSRIFFQGNNLIAATFGRGMFRINFPPIVFVDKTNTGSEDGTRSHPFRTVQSALNSVIPGAANHTTDGTLFIIRGNDYHEGYKNIVSPPYPKRLRFISYSGPSFIH